MPGQRVVLACFASLLMALPLLAQPWSGAAGLEVKVSGDAGPIGGARITLEFRDRVLPLDPPPVATDGDGRAAVLGLAPGTWQVEIAHPDYMSFVAVVVLAADAKPEVTASFLEATATSIEAMKVRFGRTRGPASPFLAETAPAEPLAVAAPVPEAPTERRAPPTPETAMPSSTPPAAPAEPLQAVEPPPPRPAVERETGTALGQAGVDAPEAPAAAPPKVETSRPALPEPLAPASQPEAAPAPPPVPPAPAAPSTPTTPALPPATLRSYGARTCMECKPGEWAVTASAEASAGGGPCPAGALEGLVPALRQLGDADEIEIRSWVGALGQIAEVVPAAVAQEVGAALAAAGGGSSACAVAGVVLPTGARFSGFQYEVAGPAGSAPCLPDRDCEGGVARWHGPPRLERGPNATVLVGLFEYRSGAPASGMLTVYFTPPSPRWRPGGS